MIKVLDYKITSVTDKHHEITVTFDYDGYTLHKYIYVSNVEGKDEQYYLDKALEKLHIENGSGKLTKYAKKLVYGSIFSQIKDYVTSKPNLVKVVCAGVLCAALITTTTLAIYFGVNQGKGGGSVKPYSLNISESSRYDIVGAPSRFASNEEISFALLGSHGYANPLIVTSDDVDFNYVPESGVLSFLAPSHNVTISVEETNVHKTFNQCTWSEIKEIINGNANDTSDWFKVGDTKRIQLKHQVGTDIYQTIRIIGIDEESDGFDPLPGITFQFDDLICDNKGYSLAAFINADNCESSTSENFRDSTVNAVLNQETELETPDAFGSCAGWFSKESDDDFDTEYLNSVYRMLPDDLSSMVSDSYKDVDIFNSSSWGLDTNVKSYKLFPLSLSEMGISEANANDTETPADAYSYYSNGGTKVRKQIVGSKGAINTSVGLSSGFWSGAVSYAGYHKNGGAPYLTRSAYHTSNTTSSDDAFVIKEDGTHINFNVNENAVGLAPAFCILAD